MRLFRVVGIVAAAMLAAGISSAEHYRFRNFGPDEGLNTAVSQIVQDRTGFLWVGTGDGLYRYDGARFQRFGREEGLPGTSIRALHESADGVLWVLTGHGLARSHQAGFSRVPTGVEASAGDWHTVEFSSDDKLYVGNDHGLLVAAVPPDGSLPKFTRPPGTPADPVPGIYAEPGGNVWFGCGLELCLLDGGKLRKFGEADGLPRDRWGAMLRDAHGEFWVRGIQHLYSRPSGASRFQARDRGLPQSSNTIMTVITDRDGTLLVSTDLGVARLVNGRWELTGSAQGLPSDTVTTVYQDREGSLWIGMWGAGIARWAGYGEWTSWNTADGLSNNIVWSIRRDPGGALFAGTDHGLVRFDAGKPSRIWTRANGLGGDKVKAIAVGPDGSIWAGCLPGGISRIDPRTGHVRTFGQAAGLSDLRIISIHFDRENRLWASAGEGLFRAAAPGLEPRFERQIPPGSNARTMFFRFHEDRQGRIWIGSSDGLFCWDHGVWRRLATADGLQENAVTHVTQTDDGDIWIAYRTPLGISRIRPTAGGGLRVEHITKQDGLPSNYSLFLGLDQRRNLWVGTDRGVATASSGKWIVYTHDDGLVWDDCAANAFLAESDGAVWIGTLKGLSRFQPRRALRVPAAPPVVITSVRFGDRPSAAAGYSEVSYRDRDFSVSFSGLTFTTERNVRFRYRLVGLDERWVETALREVRYSSLPSGSYRFEVSARNGSGAWSPAPAEISFRVVPPWWRRWWSLTAALAACAGAIASLVRARIRNTEREHRRLEAAVRERTEELELQGDLVKLQKREIEELLRKSQEASRLKSEFLANMSHEIRTPMNAVIGMAQLALTTSLDTEQREYVDTIRDSADALLVVINDILDFSKIEAGKMELLQEPFNLRKCVGDVARVFSWKAREKGLQLTSNVGEDVPELLVGDADRLRQILLNLVGNAMKFTEAGGISITVSRAPEGGAAGPPCTLAFSVRDTGIGIPSDKQKVIFEAFAQADGSTRRRQGGTGLGLAICAKLLHLMNSRMEVQSEPGRGSEFSFCVDFRVPAGELQETGDRAAETASDPPKGNGLGRADAPLHILLAEDNLVNQKVAHRILEKRGHSVLVVGDGREAVEAARRERFDLILMDVQMPVMDGFEATAAIRNAEQKDSEAGQAVVRVPIIAMTAHAMSGYREDCLRAGMDGYITKPIVLSALIETIEKVRPRGRSVPAGSR